MKYMLPVSFYEELTDERLSLIATKLLDVRDDVKRDLNSSFDDNYTWETTVFGRSKNMLIEMARDDQYEWMSLTNPGMDITFNIERVPCRFFRDDHDSPEKAGFFKRNHVDDLFPASEDDPVMWRFIVEKAMTETDEDQVFFAGYNSVQAKVSEWVYRASAPQEHSVDIEDMPDAVILEPASVRLRNSQGKTGTDQ
jgi:hypothetical protein